MSEETTILGCLVAEKARTTGSLRRTRAVLLDFTAEASALLFETLIAILEGSNVVLPIRMTVNLVSRMLEVERELRFEASLASVS